LRQLPGCAIVSGGPTRCRLTSGEQIQVGPSAAAYLTDAETASIVYLAEQLRKPLLKPTGI
jgi:hypothetical protein